jgi:hypothetical protein
MLRGEVLSYELTGKHTGIFLQILSFEEINGNHTVNFTSLAQKQ